jgi:hypothetical protein
VDHVHNASPISIVAHTHISISTYGTIANALHIPSTNDNPIFIVVSRFHTRSLYAGLAKFTIVVIIVDAIIISIIAVCISHFI